MSGGSGAIIGAQPEYVTSLVFGFGLEPEPAHWYAGSELALLLGLGIGFQPEPGFELAFEFGIDQGCGFELVGFVLGQGCGFELAGFGIDQGCGFDLGGFGFDRGGGLGGGAA